MGVKATHKDYTRFSPKWKRVRDVVAGQDAIHTGRAAYLPKLKNEDETDYSARVARSDFFNGTWRTIDALSGMAFRKPPTVEVPPAIEPYLDDITMAGVDMVSFARETVEEVLGPGRIGILVDHPPAQFDENGNVVPITKAVAEQRGERPTLLHYFAETIRNWRFSRIDNAWVLSMVTLGEQKEKPKDEFESEWVDRYRVLDLIDVTDDKGNASKAYRQRVFEIIDDKDVLVEGPFFPLMNNKPLRRIPFFLVGAGGMNDCIDEPPLIDLVDKNIAHYQVNSDYRHGLHFCGLPTAFFAGVTSETDSDGKPKQIYIGGSAAIVASEPNAKAEYLEFTGQGLAPMEKALDRIERQMALLGARMIADESKQAETLGATQIKRAGENSVLAKIVEGVSDALEAALAVFAEWAGHPGEITYQINRDFMPAMMDAQTLTAIFAGVQSGNISKQEAFELFKRGDLIDPGKAYDEHQEEIDIDTPDPARPTPKPGEEDDLAA